ncbi:fatty acid oxidation complex subunit alpha FadJ [Gallaecimonas xiamenensis]|uniref:enoyl-CoA hydratase n=1 Tax=Gallaecimonas xiamenensis 3-C-1 TaxID=745411 RepID=K2JLN5_9GAMM|nr:fatty acid oxidation complex subunit alpha FadJ [Gallaecimonas xiamenensis]EKE76223.1 multifunctional fatty acid oxidation complex subunit alpha [Gallaecimonas xiamenensis 3-C-1]
MTDKTFSFALREDGIGIITMDVPGESMNTLKAAFAEEIRAILADIRHDPAVKGLVLVSGKQGSFIAGADIGMLDKCESSQDAEALSKAGHAICAELESLKVPLIAAIHGPCLGGGLELAMACHGRVASDWDKTALGLPEVQLGLLPGSGGTQRLPRLVGIQKALDMMLTGKQLRPAQAKKAGLVDEVVPQSILLDVAIGLAKKGKPLRDGVKLGFKDKLLEDNGVGRNIVFDQARKTVLKKTGGHYPAPLKILECVRVGMTDGMDAGLAVEAKYFGELVKTPESKQLRGLFFATTQMKKETGAEGVTPRKVAKAAVLGGGLMGGGIANVTVTKAGVPVRIKDIGEQGISHAFKYSYDLLMKKVKRRHLRKSQAQKQMMMLTGDTQYRGFHDVDIVVEAVFEDLALKHQMVKDIETHCGPETIFASNTSSLPIGQIAEAAQRPENVIGLHYFSPVDKMPLAEIIAHDKTSPQTIATTVAFARRQGKTPIVVKDGAGFYVNRILGLYMNEAAYLLMEGEPVEKLDKALTAFGMPVGPMTLLDEVGIDVGAKIAPILEKELGERFQAPAAFDKLLADGRKGKKSQKGFYLYKDLPKSWNPLKKLPKKPVDESVYRVLGISPAGRLDLDAIAERTLLQMLNEAARCLDEGIIQSARDGDIGAIFGIGFPPFLGGPFRYMDKLGAKAVVAKLEALKAQHGERFAPSPLLVKMAEDGGHFYND